jgi:hypothetical protein
LFAFTSSIVRSVSCTDHEIGRQTEQALVTPVPVVVAQPASINVTAHAIVSFESISNPPVCVFGL